MYLPVLHSGYEQFLDRHEATEILLLGKGFMDRFRIMRKDIRALDPQHAAAYLRERYRGANTWVVEPDDLPQALSAGTIVMPDEDIMRELAQSLGLTQGRIVFDRTFLRWDRDWTQVQRPTHPDIRISVDQLDRQLMGRAYAEADKSSDFWRQVGALIVIEDKVVVASHNHHLPTEYAPYFNDDPRSNFSRGQFIELSTAMHGEAATIGWCAKHGVTTAGATMVVSTFPCPVCARLMATAGLARCYFSGPYAMLDAEEILADAGVELVWVDLGDQ